MRTLASYCLGDLSTSGRHRLLVMQFTLLLVVAASASYAVQPVADEPGGSAATSDNAEQAPNESAAGEQAAGSQAADELDQALAAQPSPDQPEQEAQEPPPFLPAPKGAQRLSPEARAWIDRERGIVIVDGRVTLRRGLLEMFACPPNTKEHESIVAVESSAFVIHAALLAVGAEPGTPVEFTPEYKPPTGTQIEIQVLWRDKEGKDQQTRAQNWVRDLRTKKAMALPWVFAGSGFWRDEETGQSGYMAEAGDLVCVANFSTAMLDVPAEVTNANAGLLYEAFTERIPPLGWPVRLVFKPMLEDEQQPATLPDGQAAPADQPASNPDEVNPDPQALEGAAGTD